LRTGAVESGKPANCSTRSPKAVAKYLSEVTLLGQVFVKDDKLTVEALKSRGRRAAHLFS
jgi:elongation factor Ts